MARKCKIQREQRIEKLVIKNKNKIRDLRKKINNPNILFEEKLKLQKIFRRNIKRNSSRTRLRNRCKISGRENGNIKKFGLSRIMIRKFLGKGLLPGVVMASW
jgi:small subunit ribosomal protein S14